MSAATHLRRHLRGGGWVQLAQNLPQYLQTHGLPCSRTYRGHAFVFYHLNSGIACYVNIDGRSRFIANESHCHTTTDDLDLTPKDKVKFSFDMDEATATALVRYSLGAHKSKGEVVRIALRAFLQVVR